jgi:hypothetical protein
LANPQETSPLFVFSNGFGEGLSNDYSTLGKCSNGKNFPFADVNISCGNLPAMYYLLALTKDKR